MVKPAPTRFVRVKGTNLYIPATDVDATPKARLIFVCDEDWMETIGPEGSLTDFFSTRGGYRGAFAFRPPDDRRNWSELNRYLVPYCTANKSHLCIWMQADSLDPLAAISANKLDGFITKGQSIQIGTGLALLISNKCRIVLENSALSVTRSTGKLSLRSRPKNGPSVEIELRAHSSEDPRLMFPITSSIASEGTGCAKFELRLDDRDFAALNIDLRLHSSQSESEEQPGLYPLVAHSYPIFDPGAVVDGRIALSGCLDPYAVDDPWRSFLTFRHAPGDNGVPTHFRTVCGHRLHLRAAENSDARLVIARSPDWLEINGEQTMVQPNGPVSFTPAGAFEMFVPIMSKVRRIMKRRAMAGPHKLIAGIFGTEFLNFIASTSNQMGDQLIFAPSQPGFHVQSLRQARQLPFDPEIDMPLGTITTTAWASLRGRRALLAEESRRYVNQPEAAPTYEQFPSAAGDKSHRLRFSDPPGPVGDFFPLLPQSGVSHSGLSNSTTTLLQISAAAVQRRMGGRTKPNPYARALATSNPQWVTTPQGFLALAVGGDWQAVRLGVGNDGKSEILIRRAQGHSGRWPVQDILQREDLFLVATSIDGTLQIGKIELTLKVSDWTINFDLPSSTLHSELLSTGEKAPQLRTLILKFRRGTLEETIRETGRWAAGAVLNGGKVEQVRDHLLERIRAIKAKANSSIEEEKRLYRSIHSDRIANADWMGVIILDAQAPASGFPSGVAALAGGLDKEDGKQPSVLVPVAGIDRNRIEHSSDGLMIRESAVFAVADYQRNDEAVNQPVKATANNDFTGFRIDRLGLLIEHSEVSAFLADMKLRVGSLFGGDLAYKSTADSNAGLYPIKGTYERRLVNGQTKDVYTFVGTEQIVWAFADSPFLKTIDVARVQLASSVTQGMVNGRFSLSGALSVNPEKFSLLGVSLKKVQFSDAAVVLEFPLDGSGSPNFHVELGAIRLNVSDDGGLDKLFSQMPFKLSGLLVGGDWRKGGFKLPDLGFFKFAGGGAGDALAFGLEFELDAGFLGRLVSSARRLGVHIAIAWPSFKQIQGGNWVPTLGFRFKGGGGPLELGLQGVLRLTAEDVSILDIESQGKKLFLVALKTCRLEVVGYKIPDPGDKLNLYIYAPPDEPAKVGWFGALSRKSVGNGFNLEFLGIGQHVYPRFPKQLPATTKEFVQLLEDATFPKQSNRRSQVQALLQDSEQEEAKRFLKKIGYDGKAGWLIGMRASIAGVIRAALAFADLPDGEMYGLRVEIPESGPGPNAQGFMADAMYRRLADDLGVFSIEFTVPEYFRTFDLAAVTVVIGTLGLEVYTNGDWRFRLGFPRGLDYTGCFQVQILPFIGWGGVYFAKKSARTSSLLVGKNCEPVLELGFACRVGLGKEIRRGPFAAAASISIYGILEGGFGVQRPDRSTYLAVVGRIGVIAEILGVVDFGIARAAVGLRVWNELGLKIETGEPIVVLVDVGVSVHIRVVIATIRVWRCTIEIAVNFSFETQISFRWELHDPRHLASHARIFALEDLRPIKWEPVKLWSEPISLPLTLALDAAILDPMGARQQNSKERAKATNIPVEVRIVPIATLLNDSGERAGTDLVAALFLWALSCRKRNSSIRHPRPHLVRGGDEFSREEFDKFALRIEQPRNLSAGSNALSYTTIAAFLGLNFDVSIETPPPQTIQSVSAEQHKGTAIPLPPDLVLQTEAGKVVWSADSSLALDTTKEAKLRNYFDQMAAFARDQQRVGTTQAADEKRAAEMIFEDWIAMLLKSAILTARRCFDLDPKAAKLSVDTLLAKVRENATQSLSMASRFLLYGLRVPHFDDMGNLEPSTTKPLYDMLGQQIDPAIAPAGTSHLDLILATTPRTRTSWLRVVPNLDRARIDMVEVRKLQQLKFQAPTMVSARQGMAVRLLPKLYPLGVNRVTVIRGAFDWQLRLFPEELAGDMTAAQLVEGKMGVVQTDAQGRRATTPIPTGASWTWASTITVSIRAVRGTDGSNIQGLYALVGADEHNRGRLDALLENKTYASWRDGLSVHILRPVEDEYVMIDPLAVGVCKLLKTNLSVENHPPEEGRITLAEEDAFAADLNAQPLDFLRLVRQCSIVNTGGFWLSYGKAKEWFDDKLRKGQPVKLILAVEYASRNVPQPDASASVPPFVDSLLIKSAALAACELEFERTDSAGTVAVPAAQPGCIVIEAERENPNFASRAVLTTDEKVQREIQVRYNLIDYGFAGSHPGFSQIPADGLLPSGPETHKPDRNESLNRSYDPGIEPQKWKYRIVVPLYRWATANIGNKSPSPYAGIGATGLSLQLGARDIFGNRLATALPRGSLRSNASGIGIAHLYRDRIPTPSEWPGVTFVYRPARAGSNAVEVSAHFDSNLFVQLDKRARQIARQKHATSREMQQTKDDIRAFYSRLGQILACDDVSTLVSARVENDKNEVIEGTPVNAIDPLRSFVAAIWTVLTGGTVPPKKLDPLLATVDIGGLVQKMPAAAPLSIVLVVARDPRLLDAVAKSDSSIGSVSLTVPMGLTDVVPTPRAGKRPIGRADAPPAPWVDFAMRFEAAIPGLRFLRGIDRAGAGRAWIAKKDLVDLSAAFGRKPTQYVQAIAPLSTQLVSAQINYSRLETGERKNENVVDADLDALAAAAIDLLETALEPVCAAQICIADPKAFATILAAKRQMASAYAARVVGTRPTEQAAKQTYRDQAGKLVYDRLSADLRGAYDIGGIVQIVGAGYSETGLKRRFLYGEPSFVHANSSNQGKLSFGVAKFERKKTGIGEVPPALSVVVSWRHGAEAEKPWDLAGELSFRPGFVEISSRSADQADDAYVPSQWLQILTPVPSLNWTIEGNLPLRRFPETPKVLSHNMCKDCPDSPPKTIVDHMTAARSWTYRFTWSHAAAEQDSFDLVVVYPRSQPAAFAQSVQDMLLEELIALDRNKQNISDALARMSRATDPLAMPSETEKKAAVFLSVRLKAIASALARYVKESPPAVCTEQKIPIEPPSKNNQDYDALTLRRGNNQALLLQKAQTAQARTRFVATIGTKASKMTPALDTDSRRLHGNTSVVTDSALARGHFILDSQHLDALQEPAAWSAVRVVRNPGLCDSFVYRTPWARVVEALPARNVYSPWFSLVGANGPKVELESCLSSFLKVLFDRPNDVGAYSLQAFATLAVPLTPPGVTPDRDALGNWAAHPLPSISARPVTIADHPSFARDLATMISDWHRATPISQDPTLGGCELRFAFTVFGRITKDTSGGSMTVQVPVLHIPHAYVPIIRLSI